MSAATRTSVSPETETLTGNDPHWRVTVHNDPVNLIGYVVLVFQKVLAMKRPEAVSHMMEVHTLGHSIVWTGAREPSGTARARTPGLASPRHP